MRSVSYQRFFFIQGFPGMIARSGNVRSSNNETRMPPGFCMFLLKRYPSSISNRDGLTFELSKLRNLPNCHEPHL